MDLTKSLLREIANGKTKFEPEDDSPKKIKEFQHLAIRLKSAYEKKLMREAHFQVSRLRDIHGMYITVLISGGLTFEGEQYLDGTHEDFEETNMTNQTINIHSPNAVQIGDHNTQEITIAIQSLIEKIESSNGSDPEKAKAKSLLQEFLKHPLVSTIVGATISVL